MGLILLWSEYPEISDELKLVEEYIKKNIASRNKFLFSIVSELVEAGGKRLRPALAIIASKFGKYDRKKILPAAGALEILHTATLVHDDIIDRSSLRRGKLTVAEKYGSDMAIYTGDFLFTKAVLMLSKGIAADRLDIIAKAIKIICEGEVDQYKDRFNINISVMSYLKRISRKTAILFSSACALGAYAGKCPPGIARKLAKFGLYYGMAFQIRDDLNDYLSDTGKEGKPVGNDIARGIITLPAIYALRNSEELRGVISKAFEKRDRLSTEDVLKIAKLVRNHGGIDFAKDTLYSYVKKGMEELKGLPDNNYKTLLEKLILSLGT